MAKLTLHGSIELTKLINVRMEVTGKNGKVMGTFIPDKVNYVDNGENNRVFISTVIWINDEENEHGQIGSVKQSLPSKIYKDLGKEKSKEISDKFPYLGNLKDFSGGSDENTGAASDKVFEPTDDLPF